MKTFKIITYKTAYKFPLQWDEGSSKVFTKDYTMAFDFPFMRGMFGDREELILSNEQQKEIVSIINGEKKGNIVGDVEYVKDDAVVTVDKKILLVIRGWGYLTGVGGLNIPPEKAAPIQDEFGEYIVKKLKGE